MDEYLNLIFSTILMSIPTKNIMKITNINFVNFVFEQVLPYERKEAESNENG